VSGADVHLYVSADLQWFEVPTDTALAHDITQGDQDCRRAYRRVDSLWWAWLHRMHGGFVVLSQIRKRLVELRGENAVAKAEAMRTGHDYFPPLPIFPSLSEVTYSC
jgi:hypothetical protein